jgi:Flp pilus assembly protein TadG
MRDRDHGQVLVMIALLLVVLLGFAAFAVDIGRQLSERRHVQNAADAAALAACRSLIAGDSDAAAIADARAVALINLENSPTGTSGRVAADGAPEYADGHAGDPAYLTSGILVSGTTVRVAIDAQVPTTLARVVGISQLGAGARARCRLQGGPAVPIVARRYENAPGPGGSFTDFLATSGTSTTGSVDALNTVDGATGLVGYLATGRTPASESDPGPTFSLYGPNSKASNASDFRGFIALDVRNFQDTTSRIYYNGVTAGTTVQTLKDKEGEYILSGYPGPMFPAVVSPADPNDQVAALSGNDTSMVVGNFSDSYAVGDRILLAVYNGTVMEIPDFAISPPSSFAVAATGTLVNGPNFVVSRNDSFNSTVTLHLHGDLEAAAAGHPEYDLVPDPPVTPPAAGDMNQPTWSTDVFIPAKNGTTVQTSNIQTNAVPPGIYTVWLEGHSGNPYFQTRRVPVPVKVGGASRDFGLQNSTLSGSAATVGASISLPIYVSTTTASGTRWNSSNAVSLTTEQFSTCSFAAASIGSGQISMSSGSVVPSASGSGALSTMTINTAGLAPNCYRFVLRATGTNGDGQPVTHLQPITFSVATTSAGGSYVDIIGFAVFQVTDVSANEITGRAVTGAYADPNVQALRRAQVARLMPW